MRLINNVNSLGIKTENNEWKHINYAVLIFLHMSNDTAVIHTVMPKKKQNDFCKAVTCSSFPDGEYCLMQCPYGPFPTSVIHTVGLDEAASAKNIP